MSGPVQWSQALGRMVHAQSGDTPPELWGKPIEGFGDELDSFPISPPPYARPEAPSQVSKPKVTGKQTPKNIVALAKARLREVKVELKRMKALVKECGELERLIKAAEDKPRAVVRELKRTAG